jgi:hypothetical protein
MTRLQRENGVGRVLRSSVGCAVLTAMACAGDLIYVISAFRSRITAELPGFTSPSLYNR